MDEIQVDRLRNPVGRTSDAPEKDSGHSDQGSGSLDQDLDAPEEDLGSPDKELEVSEKESGAPQKLLNAWHQGEGAPKEDSGVAENESGAPDNDGDPSDGEGAPAFPSRITPRTGPELSDGPDVTCRSEGGRSYFTLSLRRLWKVMNCRHLRSVERPCALMNLIKSKQRVADHGEFVALPWWVGAMLNPLKDETQPT